MEVWKDIIGYEGLYQVSNLGNVKSLFRYKKVLNNTIHKGYYLISLCKNKKQLPQRNHRLVAIAFIPNPENKPQVNHIDGNKLNNNVENLEWCTPKENTQHALLIGLKKVGCESGRSKLNKNQILEIRKTYNPKIISLNSLAKKFNVSKKAILLIIQNKTYKNETINLSN